MHSRAFFQGIRTYSGVLIASSVSYFHRDAAYNRPVGTACVRNSVFTLYLHDLVRFIVQIIKAVNWMLCRFQNLVHLVQYIVLQRLFPPHLSLFQRIAFSHRSLSRTRTGQLSSMPDQV